MQAPRSVQALENETRSGKAWNFINVQGYNERSARRLVTLACDGPPEGVPWINSLNSS
jgi:hypothetical protein